MQPPQGYDPLNGSSGRQGGAPSWSPPPADPQWVQRPISGQEASWQGIPGPGQVPPPAQITPPPGAAPIPGGMNPGFQGTPYSGENGSDSSFSPRSEDGGYVPPKTGLPRTMQKRGKAAYILLAAVVLIFAVIAAARMLSGGGVAYGYVYYGSMSALYTGDAVLVRNETVVSEESVSQIDFVVEEGDTVKRGSLVATIYKSGFNAKEWVTLNNYRSQIKEYHKYLINNAVTDTVLMTRTNQVQNRGMEVQRLVQGARGSISDQESLLKTVMQEQQVYIKQKNPDDQKLSRLYDDENTQLQRIATWTKQFAATADGLVSFYTDGYEKALNMNTYADFSPAQVRAMYNGQAPTVETTVTVRNATDIYRMVRKDSWVVLMLCHEKDWTPIDGRTYNLVIESYDNHVLSATVLNSTRSGGELLVRLQVDDTAFLESVLYLRSCQVRLGENVNSLAVPSKAIYVQDGLKGVVINTEGGEYWTGVRVIYDDGTTAYVIPDNAGVLVDGMPVRLF